MPPMFLSNSDHPCLLFSCRPDSAGALQKLKTWSCLALRVVIFSLPTTAADILPLAPFSCPAATKLVPSFGRYVYRRLFRDAWLLECISCERNYSNMHIYYCRSSAMSTAWMRLDNTMVTWTFNWSVWMCTLTRPAVGAMCPVPSCLILCVSGYAVVFLA